MAPPSHLAALGFPRGIFFTTTICSSRKPTRISPDTRSFSGGRKRISIVLFEVSVYMESFGEFCPWMSQVAFRQLNLNQPFDPPYLWTTLLLSQHLSSKPGFCQRYLRPLDPQNTGTASGAVFLVVMGQNLRYLFGNGQPFCSMTHFHTFFHLCCMNSLPSSVMLLFDNKYEVHWPQPQKNMPFWGLCTAMLDQLPYLQPVRCHFLVEPIVVFTVPPSDENLTPKLQKDFSMNGCRDGSHLNAL